MSQSLKGHDFVIFLDAEWEATTQRNRQHFLISELARQLEGCSKILGVERPVCTLTSFFRNRDKFFQWLRFRRLRKVGSNLYIYTPFVFIHNIIAAKIPIMTMLNRYLLRMLLNRVMKHLEFNTNNLFAWVHHPYQLEDLDLVGEKLLIYDCYDDYITSGNSLKRRINLKEREQEILKRADCIIVASEVLLKEKSKINDNVYLIPNAVEYEHFFKGAQEIDELSMKNDGPVLGFTGKITPRLDFRLLYRLVNNNLDWNFVLIGPRENESNLKKDPAYRTFVTAPNVNMLGPKPYQELPLHMRSFDVCLIPYDIDNPFNIHCSPLKLYEYLATGKPVVSTNLPIVKDFKGIVRISKDREDFERQIVKAVQEKDKELYHQRLKVAKENSWQMRAEKILKVIYLNLT